METQKKIRTKIFLCIWVFFTVSIITILLFGKRDQFWEDKIRNKYNQEQNKLELTQPVYVINVSKSENLSEKAQYRGIRQIMERCCRRAQGIYLLDLQKLEDSSKRKTYYDALHKYPRVFIHGTEGNHGESSASGLLQFLDDRADSDDRFSVYSNKSQNKKYLPYYYLQFSGNQIIYEPKDQRYHVIDSKEKKGILYSDENGDVYVKPASKKKVKYYSLTEFIKQLDYLQYSALNNAVIFIQDGQPLSKQIKSKTISSPTIADFYINVIATICNYDTVPVMSTNYKALLIAFVMILITLIVLLFPYWLSVPTGLLGLFHMIIFQKKLYDSGSIYIPIVELLIAGFSMFLLVLYGKYRYHKLGFRYLPTNAVIKFTNNITKIDNSVSYSSYLLKNRKEIEAAIQSVIILPYLDEKNIIFQQIAEESVRNRRFVENHFENNYNKSVWQIRTKLYHGVKYVAFIPLPIFDKNNEEQMYTAIGLKKKLHQDAAEYISMLLLSMYIYFRAQHERGAHQKMYFSMLSLIISVIDAKDPVTAGHSQRVANISKDIGIWLGLNKKTQADLEFTALLHDIGKIGVSDYVLNKPSVFTQADFEQMKHHTVRGAEMLAEVGISSEIIDGVRHHHERMDGKGYPDGITGDQLSLFAKIIKIADVYDALTSKRQYKNAWEVSKALDIIYHGMGTEFDEKIARVFIEHMKPSNWRPSSSVKKNLISKDDQKQFRKVIRITSDFYSRYSRFITMEYPIPSRAAKDVDFSLKKGFMGYDWGETFNNESFLERKPQILDYEKETQSIVFGQCSVTKEVRNIYYYFFKGFINMGMYLVDSSIMEKMSDILQEKFGVPVLTEKRFLVYRARKVYIVLHYTTDGKCIVNYISDYMCANYEFNN